MRLFALALVTVALCVPAACSTFDAAPDGPDASGTPGDGGGGTLDGGGGEAGSAGDAMPLDAAPGAVLTVAQENMRTGFVAVDAQFIYWWSFEHFEIRKVDKADPGKVIPVLARPSQTVTALRVDPSSGIYWLESGPDEFDGGTSNRIMKLATGTTTPVPVCTRTDGLQLLEVDATRVLATKGSGVVGATKAGQPVEIGFSLDHASFGTDGTSAYYTYLGAIFRIGPTGAGGKVIDGLASPTELTFESPTMYGLVQSDGGLALFTANATSSQQPASAATELTAFPSGSLFLALDNLGVVVANATQGTIIRVARTSGARSPVVSGLMGPNAIAADARGVYWTTDSGQVGWATR